MDTIDDATVDARAEASDSASHSEPQHGLTITTEHRPGSWRFWLEGVLDDATMPQARTAVLSCMENDLYIRPLLLDLRRVSFLDSSGLALLVTLLRQQCDASSSLTLIVSPHSQPEQMLLLARFAYIRSTCCTILTV